VRGTDSHAGGLTVAEAAVSLGVSVNTIRRWIKDGRLQSERVSTPTGYAYRVFTEGVPRNGTHAAGVISTEGVIGTGTYPSEPQPSIGFALETQRAEAMAVYTRTILEPLVARLAEQEVIIREQAEALGRHAERLAGVERERDAARARLAELDRPPAPDPFPVPNLPSPNDGPSRWRRWWLAIAGAEFALVAGVFAATAGWLR